MAFALITVRGEINAQELPLVTLTEFATTYEKGGARGQDQDLKILR